jgi:hypothetical protein
LSSQNRKNSELIIHLSALLELFSVRPHGVLAYLMPAESRPQTRKGWDTHAYSAHPNSFLKTENLPLKFHLFNAFEIR